MIVDDDKFLHKVLERILDIKGHNVVGHAYNGMEALEQIVKMHPKPDVILMDHRMPIMNGAVATKEMKRIDPSLNIIFISADESVYGEAIDSGALDFLTKPIRAEVLLQAFEKHLA